MSVEVLNLSGADAPHISGREFAILPLGSIEYHGPHASLGTDTTLAKGLAERIGKHYDAVIFPPITYTFTPTLTANYPGTISISPETMQAYVYEILLSMTRLGIRRIVALNAHSENQYFLRLASEKVAMEVPSVSILNANWWRLIPPQLENGEPLFAQNDGHGHGGPLEISTTAALDRAGVDPSLGEDIDYEAVWWRGAAQIVGVGQPPRGWSGYHGKVSEIDIAKGERLVEVCVERMRELIDAWLERIQSPQQGA